MRLIIRVIIWLAVVAGVADAQRVCKRGIPCGNTCIAANRTCRAGPAKADTAAASPADSVAAKPAPVIDSKPADSTVAPARAMPLVGTSKPDSGSSTEGLAKGGQTKVWANTKSRVYHCPGSRYYGTSSAGDWMTEGAAIKAGYRGAYNKRCGG